MDFDRLPDEIVPQSVDDCRSLSAVGGESFSVPVVDLLVDQ
jgi:hypothetical protein